MSPQRLVSAFAAACALLLPGSALAASKAEVEAALASVGRYAARVLIPADGKGRADYDTTAGVWRDYEPHWHTGQAVLGLVEAWRITGDPELLAAARRGGDWWVSTEYRKPHPLGGLVSAVHGDSVGDLINFTTVSDGTAGLFALSHAVGDTKYADSAARSGDWLFSNMRVPGEDGLYYNMIDPKTGRVITDFSPHHPESRPPKVTQVARPNIEGSLAKDICRHRDERRWCDLFVAHARTVVARQHPNGLWMDFEPNDPDRGTVHPRFNLWNAEALLEAYDLTRDRVFLDAAAKTARQTTKYQRADGTIHYELKADGTSERVSVTGSATAFAGILWLRLRDYGVDGFDENIDRSLRWLLANRYAEDHPDPNLRGAVLETRVRTVDGRIRIAHRDIASSFALRFLALAWRDLDGQDVNASRTEVSR